jgi:antitoxin PrlF
MTYRVGAKGQVVIPKSIREHLGIAPGDEVEFSLVGTAVRVEPVREQPNLRASLACRGLLLELAAEHRAERDR